MSLVPSIVIPVSLPLLLFQNGKVKFLFLLCSLDSSSERCCLESVELLARRAPLSLEPVLDSALETRLNQDDFFFLGADLHIVDMIIVFHIIVGELLMKGMPRASISVRRLGINEARGSERVSRGG